MLKARLRSRWRTNIRITARDLDGRILDVREFHNIITNDGLNLIRDGLSGVITDSQIKFVAIGDDNTVPLVGDTALGNETFRKARTSFTTPADGRVNTVHYIAPAEAVGTIEELGWFAGTAAGAGAGTGEMIARVLYSRTKTALESIQIERLDTFEEA